MRDASLLHELLEHTASRTPSAPALTFESRTLTYAALHAGVAAFAAGLMRLGGQGAQRVGIWLDKRFETVIASFGAPAAGAVFVPVNPLLKPEQVRYILQDCNVKVLVTSAERLDLLKPLLAQC